MAAQESTQRSNLEAAVVTVGAVRASLEDVDEALVTAVLQVAAAVDAKPGDSGLWREYRALLQALKEATAGGSDDDATSFLVSIQTPRRTSVGDPSES